VFFHGGAFCFSTPAIARAATSRLALMSKAMVVVPKYGLAPEHCVHEIIDQGVAAYLHVVNPVGEGGLGVDPSRITIAGSPNLTILYFIPNLGESAGASLALQVMLRLRSEAVIKKYNCPRTIPRCAVLISPWVDLTTTVRVKRPLTPSKCVIFFSSLL
jgi:monoterpene epsilon-lactone hydrolase